jgi:hypothetical protein
LSEIMETEASYMTSLEVCKKVRLVNIICPFIYAD